MVKHNILTNVSKNFNKYNMIKNKGFTKDKLLLYITYF